MEQIDPNTLQSWTPYAVLTLAVLLAGYFGYAIRWGSTKGVDALIRWRAHRAIEKSAYLKEKQEREAARQAVDQKKKLIDKFLEGRLTAEGYKALLLIYDQRIQELEVKDKEKTTSLIAMSQQLSECLQTHAADKESIKGLNNLVQEMRDKQNLLEERCEIFQRKIQRIVGGGVTDPYPSPPPSPIGDNDGDA